MVELGLGSANFGMAYGALNDGAVEFDVVQQIMERAHSAGFALVDTARAYGDAENVLGQVGAEPLRVVTKTIPVRDTPESPAAQVDRGFRESLARLRRSSVDALLVHQARDLTTDGAAVWQALRAHRSEGRVRRLGASIYDAQELDAVYRVGQPEVIQLPLNVLSQTLLSNGTVARLQGDDVEVHVRSAFLQGAIISDPKALPRRIQQLRPLVERFHQACAEAGCTPVDAALGFLRTLPIDVVIVGAASVAHLDEVIRVWHNKIPDLDWDRFQATDEAMVDPRRWPQ